MHILRATPGFYWPSSFNQDGMELGGVEIQAYRLTKGIASCGIKQTVFTMGTYAKTNKDSSITIITPKRQYQGMRLKKFLTLAHWLICTMLHIIKNNKKHTYRVVQIHLTGALSPLLLCLMIKKWFKLPVVITVHFCRQTTYQIRFRLEFPVAAWFAHLEKMAFQRADGVVFLSEEAYQKVKSCGCVIDPSRVFIAGDVVTTPNEEKSSEHPAQNQSIILFAGRIAHEKGWRMVLSCAECLKTSGVLFQICGNGPEVPKLLHELKEKELNNVKYLGAVSNEEVFRLIKNCTLVLVPSKYEEFGSIVLEAGILKTPVIASNRGFLTSLLSNGRGVLIPDMDIDGFVQKIKLLLFNQDKRRQMGTALYRYVITHYTSEIIIPIYKQIYVFAAKGEL